MAAPSRALGPRVCNPWIPRLLDQLSLYVSLRVTRKIWVTRDLFLGGLCDRDLGNKRLVSLLQITVFKGALPEGAGARRATEGVNK